jgi:hypothetical protein
MGGEAHDRPRQRRQVDGEPGAVEAHRVEGDGHDGLLVVDRVRAEPVAALRRVQADRVSRCDGDAEFGLDGEGLGRRSVDEKSTISPGAAVTAASSTSTSP